MSMSNHSMSDNMADDVEAPPPLTTRLRRWGEKRLTALADRLAKLGEGSAWRAYFPETLDRPWLRLILACIAAPAFMALIAAIIHGAFFYATGPLQMGQAKELTFDLNDHGIEAFHDYVDIFYRATALWFAPSFILLVIGDLRSRRAYGVMALIAAAIDFAFAAIMTGTPQPLILFGTGILYPPLFLMIRSITGLGARPRPMRAAR